MRVLPKRSRRYGVGKEIGGCVYIHRCFEDVLPHELVATSKEKLPSDFEYHVLKYCSKTGNISFIQCFDFDTAPEPTVGDSWLVRTDATVRRRSGARDPEIYHHKWLFVRGDYEGFDVEASKKRSEQWLALEEIDFRRIGRRSYWEATVLPRMID